MPSAPALRGRRRAARRTRSRSTRLTSPTRRLTYDPKDFPAAVQENALADFGPNLSNMAAKFQSASQQGLKWLSNWIQAPERYHPKSLMPNLQLSRARRGRHRELDSLGAGRMAGHGGGACRSNSKEVKDAVDELVKLYVSKSGSFKKADGKSVAEVAFSEVDEVCHQGARRPTKSCCIWARRRFRGWAASAATRFPASRMPSRSGRRLTTGESRTPPGSITGTSRSI